MPNQRGGKKTPEREEIEKSPAFKKGQLRFELFFGAAVFANNLLHIAELCCTKRKPPGPAAA